VQKCAFSFFYLLINKGFREIKCQSQEKVCDRILQGWDQLPQKPKPAERAIWMKKVMDRMDSLLEEEIRFKIREDCACCISRSSKRIKTMKKLIKENPDLDSFVVAVQDSPEFDSCKQILTIQCPQTLIK